MKLAKSHDVDMVLLAGDLFHENKPSRKSVYHVMRSLRENCYNDRPCSLELLSDAQENFGGAFPHANYEDMDINVGIPVFSIHGNHDDPSGEGHFAALDILQVAGLLNYYGRTPESDNIQVKPVLLRKGRTRLALYGMSNVRDQRLFHTFRDGKVKFFRPSEDQDDWFNLMSVHQNHHAYNETGYLPERFLPSFMDLVIWGHEHECLINPRTNPETGFQVMQPGSSVATSLVVGESVQKHVAILTINRKKCHVTPIPLTTVRPFIMREISLYDEPSMKRIAKRDNNRTEVTKYLIKIVDEMIEEATAEWVEKQPEPDGDEPPPPPLPLVRLRVETSTPSGGSFDCENPQRFSNRFVGRVANVNDVVQFHRKKRAGKTTKPEDMIANPDEESISHLTALDTVKVEKLVREHLQAQSLTILPENSFGDAVAQFVDKDDKHALEIFLNETLQAQTKHLLSLDANGDIDANTGDVEEHLNLSDDDTHLDGTTRVSAIEAELARHRAQLEAQFSKGGAKASRRSTGNGRRFKPKPDGWDTDFDGVWEDQPGALLVSEDDEDDEDREAMPPPAQATRGRGRGGRATRGTRGGSTARGRATATTSRTARKQPTPVDEEEEDEEAFTSTTATSRPQRSTRNADADFVPISDDDNEDDVMLDADPGEDDLFVPAESQQSRPKGTFSTSTISHPKAATTRTSRPTASSRGKKATTASTSTRSRASAKTAASTGTQQSVLNFIRGSQTPAPVAPAARTARTGPFVQDDDIDDDDDDDDAFASAPLSTLRSRRR